MSVPRPGDPRGGIAYWLKQRSPSYIARRVGKLLGRYGVSPQKAIERTRRLARLLDRFGCSATLATPGSVVACYPEFIRELSAAGVELAVHSYDHVDFRSITREESVRQMTLAAEVFRQADVPFKGFRCPYLSFSHDMSGYVPEGLFGYSSNDAVWWEVGIAPESAGGERVIFDHLTEFYAATPAEEELVLPRFVGDLVEIPVSLPDDLQLLDGLAHGADGVADAWLEVLHRTHERGAIFNLLMHPESFDLCAVAYERLLAEARSLSPGVWIATLGEVSDWWRELRDCSAHLNGTSVRLDCSPRAFVLTRDGDDRGSWPGGYSTLDGRELTVNGTLPFVGAVPDLPTRSIETLRELGYVVVEGENAGRCAVRVAAAGTARELVEHVEAQPGPLVRFSPWPDGARSALCITGDLDALSLRDYLRRAVSL